MALGRQAVRLALMAWAFVLGACGEFGDFVDAGRDDAAVIDAAGPSIDAAPVDAAANDAGQQTPDAAALDAGISDAGPSFDAGPHPINPLGPGLSTLVGDSAAGFLNGPREFSLMNNPVNVVIGPDGDIFVADFNNGAIRRVTPQGDMTTIVQRPDFSRPFGMTFTPAGDFYVATDRDTAGGTTGALWKINIDTGAVNLVFDGIGRMRGLASLSDGRLVLGDQANHTIQIYNPIGDVFTFVAGQTGVPGFADGIATQAQFNSIRDIVVTDGNVLFVSDSDNHRIRRVTLAGNVTTIAGNGIAASVDGPALSSSLNIPSGLALDDDGSLFISEFSTGLIRKLENGQLITIAGSVPGYADNVDPLLGLLFANEGIDYVAPNLYISDGNNGENAPSHRVRRIIIEPPQPAIDAGLPDASLPDASLPDASLPDAGGM